jgi:hypothetical protein
MGRTLETQPLRLCKGTRSCSITSVPRSAVTKRASGVSCGMLVHHNYLKWAAKNERLGGCCHSDEEKFRSDLDRSKCCEMSEGS